METKITKIVELLFCCKSLILLCYSTSPSSQYSHIDEVNLLRLDSIFYSFVSIAFFN